MDPRPRCELGDKLILNGKRWTVVCWIVGAWSIRVTIEDETGHSHWMPMEQLRLEAKAA